VYTALIWTAIIVVGALVGAKVLILLWLIQAFGFVKMSITLVKYTPQVYLNWKRKSTEGFSLPGVLLDISGGVLSFLQMFLMSFHSGKWDQFEGGNIPKFGLSVLTIVFDTLFVVQEYMYKPRPGKQHANGYVGLEEEPINNSAYPLDGKRKSYGATV
jgi:cystinosin